MKYLLLYFIFIITFISTVLAQEVGTFIDERDGHEYKWVEIGEQIWMAENLAYKTEEGSYDWNGRIDYVDSIGRLYVWNTAINACPCGWHLSSDDEWEELAEFISQDNGGFNKQSDDWKKVGEYLLKDFWSSKNDKYNFSAVPMYIKDNNFNLLIGSAEPGVRFWTSLEVNKRKAAARSIYFIIIGEKTLYRLAYKKKGRYSVRCVKDK